MAKKKANKKQGWFCCNNTVAAGLFIGIGVGLLVGNIGAFTLIGLGIGYLVDRLIK